MSKKADTEDHENEHGQAAQDLKREEALQALHRLRNLGEKLAEVDAAAIVRDSRDLAGQGSR